MRQGDPATRSLWSASSPASVGRERLEGTIRADVAIVGGGLTGMAAALHVAELGASVVVLDAGQADGRSAASVASGGIVAPQFIRGTPLSIRAQYADDAGERFVELMSGAGSYTFGLIERHDLRCDAQPNGFLAPFNASQRHQAEQVVNEWQSFRNDVELLDAAAAAKLSGCTGYDGAVLDRQGGAVDPLAYAREMGRCAARLGAVIHHGERVLDITPGGGGGGISRLRCAGGEVVAGKIVLAANGGNTALHPSLRRTIMPLDVREVATAPLPAELRDLILPEGYAMTDRGPDIFTIRYDAAGRLITAATMPWARSDAAVSRAVNARLRARIPGWRDMPLEHVWTGRAWLNADFTPRFVKPEADMLTIQACNGRGVALAGPIGREVARWVVNSNAPLGLPVVSPRPIPAFPVARRLPNAAMALAAVKSRLGG